MFRITQTSSDLCSEKQSAPSQREKRARYDYSARIEERTPYGVNYLRRLPDAGAVAVGPGSLISWPACNSTLGAMPFSRATSSAASLCAAAIFAIVSPLRARTFVSVG